MRTHQICLREPCRRRESAWRSRSAPIAVRWRGRSRPAGSSRSFAPCIGPARGRTSTFRRGGTEQAARPETLPPKLTPAHPNKVRPNHGVAGIAFSSAADGWFGPAGLRRQSAVIISRLILGSLEDAVSICCGAAGIPQSVRSLALATVSKTRFNSVQGS